MIDAAGAGTGFAKGVEAARQIKGAGSLLHALFSVRTLGLFDLLPAPELSDYLSGLLIGAEISAAAPEGQVTILGSEELTLRYGKAAGMLDVAWKGGPRDCLVAGQVLIARAAGLINVE
jgi:2-dehydro-3-deoxygalactonokinase